MPCTCKELESQHGSGDCKCVRYREQFPNCECERHSVSDHSPGLVEDDEPLVRTLYSPHHINKATGDVTPAAFADATTRGLSVNRMQHISEAELLAKIEAKVARDQARGRKSDGFWKVVTTNCDQVRACGLDGIGRGFYVYVQGAGEPARQRRLQVRPLPRAISEL